MSLEYNINVRPLEHHAASSRFPMASRSVSPGPPPAAATPSTWSLRSQDVVRALAFSEAGLLASTGRASVDVWSLSEWRPAHRFVDKHQRRWYDLLAWDPGNPGSRVAAVASEDRTLRLWDVRAKPGHVDAFQTKDDRLVALAWNPDAKSIILGNGRNLSIYDVRQARLLVSRRFDYLVNHVNFVAEGKLAAATEAGHVEMLNPSTLTTIDKITAHVAPITVVQGNPHAETKAYFATGGDDAIVEIWRDNAIDYTCTTAIDRQLSSISSLSFSANGKLLASTSNGERTIDIAYAETGELFTTITHNDRVKTACFDKRLDGENLLLAFCSGESTEINFRQLSEAS